jgi:di/tricarboxylate transporter
MASIAGQPRFGIFEITPVGVTVALAGGLYLLLFSGRLLGRAEGKAGGLSVAEGAAIVDEPGIAGSQIGSAEAFADHRPLRALPAILSAAVFVGVILLASLNVAPIAACAFAGAVLLILLRVITPDEAYSGLRPDILMLIAGMIVLGIALDESGLASAGTERLVGSLEAFDPLLALIILYGATLFLTELLSNATVAVLITPLAVALAETLGVSPRPFLVAVMVAGSAAFATPFGYQTNVLVYQIGQYSFMDFVRVGLPLNLITWIVGVAAISFFFPF